MEKILLGLGELKRNMIRKIFSTSYKVFLRLVIPIVGIEMARSRVIIYYCSWSLINLDSFFPVLVKNVKFKIAHSYNFCWINEKIEQYRRLKDIVRTLFLITDGSSDNKIASLGLKLLRREKATFCLVVPNERDSITLTLNSS